MDHHQLAIALLERNTFEVIAWNDPLCADGIPADSDDALFTGRESIFEASQFVRGGGL